jgi:hypothetical protein
MEKETGDIDWLRLDAGREAETIAREILRAIEGGAVRE